ncbi:hypothetical protein J6590_042943 [Homalodisca vitripennis]|nr:hypothetical protein J6590_042943 [Homalodisca vitripennis]
MHFLKDFHSVSETPLSATTCPYSGTGCPPSNMPHCASAAKLRLRRQSVPSAPWVSLRSRGLSVCLRSRTVKRLAQAPPVKRRPRKKKKRLPPIDPIEEEKFLYGHAFDVLLALGLVPSQDRIKQEDAISLG